MEPARRPDRLHLVLVHVDVVARVRVVQHAQNTVALVQPVRAVGGGKKDGGKGAAAVPPFSESEWSRATCAPRNGSADAESEWGK